MSVSVMKPSEIPKHMILRWSIVSIGTISAAVCTIGQEHAESSNQVDSKFVAISTVGN